MKPTLRSALAGLGRVAVFAGLGAMGLNQAGAATVMITTDLTASATWTADNEYILTRPIYVTNGATLTIEPGTTVRGEPESSPGANDPGTLVIARGSKIRALGTAAKPIVFTDLFDDNIGSNPGTPPYDTLDNSLGLVAQWGGLILLGRTYVANNTLAGPDPTRTVQIEGLTAAGGLGLYGGGDDDDDSGVLNYISIRYGGFNLSPNNEINGLTLGGVGRSTRIDYIDIFQTKDDFVEFFGGTVGVKHFVMANNGDDGIDTDEGFRGKGQFMFVMQGTPGTDKSDKGMEQDGGNNPDGSQPFAIPTFYNVSMIGLGQKNYTAKSTDLGMVFRDNAGGRNYNSFFADFGGATLLIEGGTTTATDPLTSGQRAITPYVADGVFQKGPASDFDLELKNDTFWCFGNGNVIPTGIATNFGGVAGQLHYDNGAFTNATLENSYLACGSALPIRNLTRGTNPDATVPDPIISVDPRPAPGSPLLVTSRVPPNDGFFEPAPYRGAFSGDSSGNWAAGWSSLARVGYFTPKPQIPINADITASATWTADNEYILTQPIYVTNGATLTIEPGTTVRGEPESSPGANDPGTLVIARGSKIRALGTAAKPIVFTDLFDDNIGSNPGTPPYDTLDNSLGLVAQWGGVILLGRTYVANNTLAGPDPTRTVQIEGLTAAGGLGLYGGSDDDDDSGVLNYISIRYGGFNLSPNNEINGLTLGGVGRSTRIDYIDIFQTKDDMVELFGGTVGIKHFVMANGGDDGVDYDEGFRGKGQFLFLMQGTPGADKGDKGMEQDGGNNPDGSQPFAIPTFYNVSMIGLGQKNYTAKSTDLGMVFRDNAGGRNYNSFFADFGGATLLIEGGTTTATDPLTSGQRAITPYVADGVFQKGPASDFDLELKNDTFWCFGNGNVIPTGIATNFGGVAGQLHYDNGAFTNATLENGYLACGSALPIRNLTRGTNPDSTVPDPIISIDPRPAPGSPLLTTTRKPPFDGFFSQTSYKGAFAPGGNWAAGWSSLARNGYFPTCAVGGATNVPDEVVNVQFTNATTMTWSAPTFDARSYDVLRSTVNNNFNAATCVETSDFDAMAADTSIPPVGGIFYYLVRGVNDCADGTLGTSSAGVERTGTACN